MLRNMRTPILAALLGLSLTGCLIGDSGSSGTGAGDDDGSGDGSSDGSNGGSNGGSNNGTPSLTASVDKATVSTELLTDNMVTVTLKSSGGFTGDATLTASVVDAAGTAVPGWTVALDKATVTVAANGTATAVATVKVPSDAAALTGTVKVDVTSSLGSVSAKSDVTAAQVLTIPLTLDAGKCVYPARTLGTVKVRNGTKISWLNKDAAESITIHINGGITGLTHQQGVTMPGKTYDQTVASTTGTSPDWYCHNRNDPGAANGSSLQATP